MKLADYLKKRKMRATVFADVSGVSRPTISRLIRGVTRCADPLVARKIVKATKGQVRYDDLWN